MESDSWCSYFILQDILANDTVELDWTFRISFLSDIVKVGIIKIQ